MITTINSGGANPMDFFSKRTFSIPRIFQSSDCVANT